MMHIESKSNVGDQQSDQIKAYQSTTIYNSAYASRKLPFKKNRLNREETDSVNLSHFDKANEAISNLESSMSIKPAFRSSLLEQSVKNRQKSVNSSLSAT